MIRFLLILCCVGLMVVGIVWTLVGWWKPVQGFADPWTATACSMLCAVGAWACYWLLSHPKEL